MRGVGLLALVLLQACAAPGGIRPLRPHELATTSYQETVTAALTGSLLYERDGCLLFRDEETKSLLLPVWPDGSIFNGTSVIFHRPGKADQPIVIGEEVLVEGRAVMWPELTDPAYAPFHNQCVAQPFFVSRVRPAN
jgi:hypothetical protein